MLAFYYPGTKIETLPDTTKTTDDAKGGDKMVAAAKFIDKVWIPLNDGWGYILSMVLGEAYGRKQNNRPRPVSRPRSTVQGGLVTWLRIAPA